MSSEFLNFAAALFAILNPFGNTAIFLSVTAERSDAERRRIALVTTAAVLVTLLVPRRSAGTSSRCSASRSAGSGSLAA